MQIINHAELMPGQIYFDPMQAKSREWAQFPGWAHSHYKFHAQKKLSSQKENKVKEENDHMTTNYANMLPR